MRSLHQNLILTAAAIVLLCAAQGAAAHGDSHRHYRTAGYGHHYGHRAGLRSGGRLSIGYGHGRRYRGHYRGGSSVHLSVHAPFYAAAPRETVIVERQPLPARRSAALPDMPNFNYTPQAGQDAATLTQDRHTCERWAWRRTRADSGTVVRNVYTERVVVARASGTSILHPAASGAALGALGGAFAGDAGAGAAIGALVGATSWLLSGGGAPRRDTLEREVYVDEYVPASGPDPRGLRDALAACMQAKSYAVYASR